MDGVGLVIFEYSTYPRPIQVKRIFSFSLLATEEQLTKCKLEPTRLVPRDAFGRLSLVPLDFSL